MAEIYNIVIQIIPLTRFDKKLMGETKNANETKKTVIILVSIHGVYNCEFSY